MRFVALLLLILACSIAGCQGSGSPGPGQDDGDTPIASLLGALPSPSELSARHAAASEAPPKSVSNVMMMYGASYTDDPLPSNVSRVGTELWLYAETLELTYAFFTVGNTFMQSMEQFTGVWTQVDWETGQPQAPHGLYIGLPDYDADTWSWVGPVTGNGGWIDVSDRNLRGTIGPEYLAVVAYAPTNNLFELEKLAISHTSVDGTLGNEWLYYTHENPAEPTFGTSISRVRADGSEIDPLFIGSETIENSHPVITQGAQRLLAFAHSNNGPFEIWRSGLDGSTPSVLMSLPDEDLLPVGWHPEGESFLFLRRSQLVLWYDLWARDVGEGVSGMLHPENLVVREAAWDPSGGSLFSAIIVSGNPDTRLSFIWDNGPLPVGEFPNDIILNLPDTHFMEPAPYAIPDGQGGVFSGIICTLLADSTYKLLNGAGSSDNIDWNYNYIVSAEYNLRSAAVSPDGTRVAFVRCEPGESSGTLVVTDFVEPDLDTATELVDNVQGDVVWYDPDF